MANSCYSQYRVQCVSEEQAEDLCNKLNEWSTSKTNLVFNKWLGTYLINSGLAEYDYETHKWNKEEFDSCTRGHVVGEFSQEFDVVSFDVETAWSPQHTVWEYIIGTFAKGAKVSYTAEEPGCEIKETNDEDLINKYEVRISDPEILSAEFDESTDTNAVTWYGYWYNRDTNEMFVDPSIYELMKQWFKDNGDDEEFFASGVSKETVDELISTLSKGTLDINTYNNSDWEYILEITQWNEGEFVCKPSNAF